VWVESAEEDLLRAGGRGAEGLVPPVGGDVGVMDARTRVDGPELHAMTCSSALTGQQRRQPVGGRGAAPRTRPDDVGRATATQRATKGTRTGRGLHASADSTALNRVENPPRSVLSHRRRGDARQPRLDVLPVLDPHWKSVGRDSLPE